MSGHVTDIRRGEISIRGLSKSFAMKGGNLNVLRGVDLDVAAGIIVSTAFGLVTRIFTSSAELNAAARQMRLLMAAGQA